MTRPTEPDPHTRDRHWPRDAPIRWGSFFGGLVFQFVAVAAVAAHLVIGLLSIVAIGGTTVDGAGEWLLAIAWGAGALWQLWSWWFDRAAVVVPPIVAGGLLFALATR